MTRTLLSLVAVFVLPAFVVSARGYEIKQVQISVLSPQGIRFSYPDEQGVSLVAYHYSVNKPLNGVAAGDWNFDVTAASGGYWTHENTGVAFAIGDTVNYWVYVTYQGVGYQQLGLSWTAPEPTAAPAKTTKSPATDPPATDSPVSNPPVSTKPTAPTEPPVSGNPSTPASQCSKYPCDSACDMNMAPCNGLIFEENFDTFNLDIWEHEITAGGGGNWEFQYYTNNRSNSYVRDGTLFLKPTLTTETFGDGFLETGRLALWGASPANLCTGNAWWGCERNGNADNILNPIQSARIRTVNSFSFKYGRLEVEAKMPSGDWIWPAIWLLSKRNAYGEWPASGEIDLIESKGNRNLQDADGNAVGVAQMGSTMHWGPFWPLNPYWKTHATKRLDGGKTFGTDFHLFELDWTPDNLRFYVDKELILTVDPEDQGHSGFWEFGGFETDAPGVRNPWANTGNKLTPFDQEFYLILNVAVGGTAYFGDHEVNSPAAKPWLNTSPTAAKDFWAGRNDWLPTWNQDVNNGEDAAMQVNYIKVYAHEGLTTYHLTD